MRKTLKQWRVEAGFTLKKLGSELDYNYSTISGYERGLPVSSQYLKKFAHFFRISEEDIILHKQSGFLKTELPGGEEGRPDEQARRALLWILENLDSKKLQEYVGLAIEQGRHDVAMTLVQLDDVRRQGEKSVLAQPTHKREER